MFSILCNLSIYKSFSWICWDCQSAHSVKLIFVQLAVLKFMLNGLKSMERNQIHVIIVQRFSELIHFKSNDPHLDCSSAVHLLLYSIKAIVCFSSLGKPFPNFFFCMIKIMIFSLHKQSVKLQFQGSVDFPLFQVLSCLCVTLNSSDKLQCGLKQFNFDSI